MKGPEFLATDVQLRLLVRHWLMIPVAGISVVCAKVAKPTEEGHKHRNG